MSRPSHTVKVQEIPGEPLRYRVESWGQPGQYHIVDLSENGGNGGCSCTDFTTRCNVNFKESGGKWVHYGFPGHPAKARSQCRHIYCARLKYTDTTLRGIAARLNQ